MSNPDDRRPSPQSLARARRLLAVLVAMWLVVVAAAIWTGNLVLVLFAVVLAPVVAWSVMEVRRAVRDRRS